MDVHGYLTPTELWVNLRHLVESNPRQRQYFWVYTGQLDHFSHYYHPDDERTAAEFYEFSWAFEQNFLERLSPAFRKGTLILLTVLGINFVGDGLRDALDPYSTRHI